MTKSCLKLSIRWLTLILVCSVATITQAGQPDADVVKVRAIDGGNSGWTFHVTVKHPDTGWSDYSNGWDVVTDTGEVLKTQSGDAFTRVLFHPHETEQPFTRSQGGLKIDPSVKQVTVRAHDIVDGFGGKEVVIDLQSDSGPDYTISHK